MSTKARISLSALLQMMCIIFFLAISTTVNAFPLVSSPTCNRGATISLCRSNQFRESQYLVSSSHQHSGMTAPKQFQLFAASDDAASDDDGGDEVWLEKHQGPWELRNDFEMFLNQCAIQSFCFVLKSMRDPQTVLWVEQFTQPSVEDPKLPSYTLPSGKSDHSKLLTYHGLAAINTTVFPTWDSYFTKLLEQPAETFRIESYATHIPDYDLDINPASLCSRIISVREQIAREFVRDLEVVSALGGQTLESYWEKIKERSEAESSVDVDDPSQTNMVKLQRQNLLFLDYDADFNSDDAPSPLRKGNFDLLVLLATQEAIHRVLNNPDRQRGPEFASNRYLREFYVNRIRTHFTGSQFYSRADDFLEELLSESPKTVPLLNDKNDVAYCLIDPTRIAELVLLEREKVALEWRDIAQNVPNTHMQIKRMQLNLLMGKPADTTPESSFE